MYYMAATKKACFRLFSLYVQVQGKKSPNDKKKARDTQTNCLELVKVLRRCICHCSQLVRSKSVFWRLRSSVT